MITQVRTPRQRQRFRSACRGKLCLGVTMPQALALFGKSQPGRFFTGPTLALDVGGSTAWLAGHANPDELASFLHFCGCKAVILDEAECPPPTGWARAKSHFVFGLAPGKQLPEPAVEETLWASLHFDPEPPAGPVAQMLFPDRPTRRDDFYSELCSKRARGRAVVWALEQGGELACTVGAYAIGTEQAYMACGETAEPLRGRGIGGRLIVRLANTLSAQGLQRLAMDFPLPCPGGQGTPLTLPQLEALAAGRPTFYSDALCARYFTLTRQGQTHFVLFDDARTLRRKLDLARQLGIRDALVMLPEVEDLLEPLFAGER